MLRSLAQRQRRELVFADPRAALTELWRYLEFARVGPFVGLLLVLLLVLWAIGEHAQRRAVLQEVETQRYFEQFAGGPVAEARARLNRTRHEDQPGRTGMVPAGPVPNDEAIRDPGRTEDIETMLRFYRRLALCIRMRSCDPSATAAWFGNLPWRFRDRHHRYLKNAYPDQDLDRLFSTISPRPDMAARSWAALD